MKRWTTNDTPNLQGKVAIVTGAGGLGYEDALALAGAGARVIVAGRDATKGEAAVASIKQVHPKADVGFEVLDLAELTSVKVFADRMLQKLGGLDILINNAGVMTPPKRLETKDGFELQFGTNYLGHFALTAHLLPLIKKVQGRVISLSSVAARRGAINFDDLQAEQSYVPMPVYAQSKLACLMFAFELQKRSDANGWGVTSIAAHPGISRTELLVDKPGATTVVGVARKYAWFLFQPVAQGALPTLFAATSPDAKAGAYYGPDGFRELRGYPKLAGTPERAGDTAAASKLWQVSEELAGVAYPNGAS